LISRNICGIVVIIYGNRRRKRYLIGKELKRIIADYEMNASEFWKRRSL